MQVEYTAADLTPSHGWLADHVTIVQADITDQPWPDHSFDVVIVSHVLEMVPDDRRAMRELRRVIADDGLVISQEPYDPHLETTDENPVVTGVEPIVRIYGPDLISRWEEAGFEVRAFPDEVAPGDEVFEALPR